jgi:hypothetical protein
VAKDSLVLEKRGVRSFRELFNFTEQGYQSNINAPGFRIELMMVFDRSHVHRPKQARRQQAYESTLALHHLAMSGEENRWVWHRIQELIHQKGRKRIV